MMNDLIEIPTNDPVYVFQKQGTLDLIKVIPETASFLSSVCGVHSGESEGGEGGHCHGASDRLLGLVHHLDRCGMLPNDDDLTIIISIMI